MFYHIEDSVDSVEPIMIHCYRDHKTVSEDECFNRVWNTRRNSELKICSEFCGYGNYLKKNCPYGKGGKNKDEIAISYLKDYINFKNIFSRPESNSEKLKILRFQKGISQRILTELLGDFGMKAVANWECDYRSIPNEAIRKMNKIFSLEEDYFQPENQK